MVYSLICIAKLRRLEWVKYATIRKIRNKCIIKFDGGRDNVSRKGWEGNIKRDLTETNCMDVIYIKQIQWEALVPAVVKLQVLLPKNMWLM